jgi:hypothetical protein
MDLEKLIEEIESNTSILKEQLPAKPAEGEETTPAEPDMDKVKTALEAIKKAIDDSEDAENPDDPFQKVIDGYAPAK